MASIVIVTYYMIPFAQSFGSCQRMYSLAEQLIKENYDVTVVSKCGHSTFINFGYPINFNSIYLTISGKAIDNKDVLNYIYTFNNHVFLKKILNRFIVFFSKYANKIYRETNISHSIEPLIWIWRNTNNFKKIIEAKNAEAVIISAPPFHLHKIGRIVKKMNTNIKIIIDYRDPWNYVASTFSSRIEFKNIFYADLVTVFSEKYKNHLLNIYNLPKKKIIPVYNGFASNTWAKTNFISKSKRKKIIFTYTGSYTFSKDNYADITIILNAIEQLRNKEQVLFRFIGCSSKNEENYWKKRLDGNVEFVGLTSHVNTLRYLAESDVQIVLFRHIDQRSKFMITTKFFDYIKSEKIIWGIGDSESNFCEWISQYDLGFTCEPKVADISLTITKICDYFINNSSNKKYNLNIDSFSREIQFKKLIEYL